MNPFCIYCMSPLNGGNHDTREYTYECGTKLMPHSTEFSVKCLKAYADYLEDERDHWYFEYNFLHDECNQFLAPVNGVTAPHRHGNPISQRALDRLSNAQIDFEKFIEKRPYHG